MYAPDERRPPPDADAGTRIAICYGDECIELTARTEEGAKRVLGWWEEFTRMRQGREGAGLTPDSYGKLLRERDEIRARCDTFANSCTELRDRMRQMDEEHTADRRTLTLWRAIAQCLFQLVNKDIMK